MAKDHLAVDFGATSARGVLGRIQDGALHMELMDRFPTTPLAMGGRRYIDVAGFYRRLIAILEKAIAIRGKDLISIGMDTWGCTFGLLDAQDELLGLPRSGRDGRIEGMDERMERIMPYARRYSKCGSMNIHADTLHQLFQMAQLGGGALFHADKLLFLGDILNFWLTGKYATDATIASTSALFQPEQRQWCEELLAAFSIPRHILPPVLEPGKRLGYVRALTAVGCGEEQVRVILPGIHDSACAMTAIPATGENWAFISSGTWSVCGIEMSGCEISEAGLRHGIAYHLGNFGKTLLQKNVCGMWIIEQMRISWKKRGIEVSYPALMESLERAEPHFAYFDPDSPRFRRPEDMLEAVRTYLAETGQRAVDSRNVGQLARIAFESMGMKYKLALEALKEVGQNPIERLYIVGGGSQNGFLNQFVADILEISIEAGPPEATVMGNLLMQAYACGEVTGLEEIREISKNTVRPTTYFPKKKPCLAREIAKFRGISDLRK